MRLWRDVRLRHVADYVCHCEKQNRELQKIRLYLWGITLRREKYLKFIAGYCIFIREKI